MKSLPSLASLTLSTEAWNWPLQWGERYRATKQHETNLFDQYEDSIKQVAYLHYPTDPKLQEVARRNRPVLIKHFVKVLTEHQDRVQDATALTLAFLMSDSDMDNVYAVADAGGHTALLLMSMINRQKMEIAILALKKMTVDDRLRKLIIDKYVQNLKSLDTVAKRVNAALSLARLSLVSFGENIDYIQTTKVHHDVADLMMNVEKNYENDVGEVILHLGRNKGKTRDWFINYFAGKVRNETTDASRNRALRALFIIADDDEADKQKIYDKLWNNKPALNTFRAMWAPN